MSFTLYPSEIVVNLSSLRPGGSGMQASMMVLSVSTGIMVLSVSLSSLRPGGSGMQASKPRADDEPTAYNM